MTRALPIHTRRLSPSSQRGFTLIELLVAMAITLLSTVIMLQVFSNFEGQRRRSVSGSDIQIGAALAQLMLAKDIKDAGFGINDPGILGCRAVIWPDGVTPVPVTIAPVLITDGGAAGSDTITIAKGGKIRNADEADNYVPISTTRLTDAHTGNTSDFVVSSTASIAPFDIIAITQPDATVLPPAPPIKCSIFEATAVNGVARTISHAGGNDGTLDAANVAVKTMNHATGGIINGANAAMPFSNSPQTPSQLYVIGRKPAGGLANNDMFVNYSVQNGRQLVRTMLLRSSVPPVGTDAAQPIMDDVLSVQAQYGFDNTDVTNGLQIDTWTDATGGFANLTQAQMQGMAAVRVAVVVRSKQIVDKRAFPDLCKYSIPPAGSDTDIDQLGLINFWPDPADPTAASSAYLSAVAAVKASLDGSDGDTNHWSCYRYRTFETTIPLRNVIWSTR